MPWTPALPPLPPAIEQLTNRPLRQLAINLWNAGHTFLLATTEFSVWCEQHASLHSQAAIRPLSTTEFQQYRAAFTGSGQHGEDLCSAARQAIAVLATNCPVADEYLKQFTPPLHRGDDESEGIDSDFELQNSAAISLLQARIEMWLAQLGANPLAICVPPETWLRLNVSIDQETVEFDGETFIDIPSDGLIFLDILVKAQGDWVGKKAFAESGINHPERITKKLPPRLQHLIEAKAPYGHRLRRRSPD